MSLKYEPASVQLEVAKVDLRAGVLYLLFSALKPRVE